MQYVLFLCTGNFYRSRFAEILFNHLAERDGLGWRADSRALAIERGYGINFGPVSQHVKAALDARGIHMEKHRDAQQACERDFARVALIIALKEAEHRPLAEERFPRYASQIAYWHVHDTDQARPEEALAEVEKLVIELVEALQAGKTTAAWAPVPTN